MSRPRPLTGEKMPRIFFRGPMMVLTDLETVRSILIPDGAKMPPNGTHPDRSLARPHYAGILVVSSTNPTVVKLQVDLNGHRVMVSDGTTTDCQAQPRLARVPDLNAMINQGPDKVRLASAIDLEEKAAASIVLIGGGLEPIDPPASALPYTLPTPGGTPPRPAPILPVLEWTPDRAEATIEISRLDGSGWTTYSVASDDVVLIYNWDVKHPRLVDFVVHPITACPAGKVIVDHDFKWAYALLVAPGNDWDAWLRDVAGGKLPAPEIRCTRAIDAQVRAAIAAPTARSSKKVQSKAARPAVAALPPVLVDIFSSPTGECGNLLWTGS